MNGRRYSEASPESGTQARSCLIRTSQASMKSSTGSSGIAMRRAEAWKRAALASGRNVATEPSGWR